MWMNASYDASSPWPAGEQVALEQALQQVLAQHLDHAAAPAEADVDGRAFRHPLRRGPPTPRRAGSTPSRRDRTAGSRAGSPHHVGEPPPEHAVDSTVAPGSTRCSAASGSTRSRSSSPLFAAVALMRVAARPHSSRSGAGAPSAEQLVGPVRPQPVLEEPQVSRVVAHARERHLVRTPRALDGLAVDLARPGPALRRARSTISWAAGLGVARVGPDAVDPVERVVERARERLARASGRRRRRPRRSPARTRSRGTARRAATRACARARRVRDLPAVEVEDRQHRAVRRRVQERVQVPARGERARLGLAVADHARHQARGASSAAPYACASEYPSSPPSWIEPASAAPHARARRRASRTAGTARSCRARRGHARYRSVYVPSSHAFASIAGRRGPDPRCTAPAVPARRSPG